MRCAKLSQNGLQEITGYKSETGASRKDRQPLFFEELARGYSVLSDRHDAIRARIGDFFTALGAFDKSHFNNTSS